MKHLPGLVALFVSFWVAPAWAQYLDHEIPYQGYLERDGQALNGEFDLRFEILTDPAAGTCTPTPTVECVWDDEQSQVVVAAGRFSVQLGPLSDSLWQHAALYVAIPVRRHNEPTEPDYTVLKNRQRILPVPLAAHGTSAPIGGPVFDLEVVEVDDGRVSYRPPVFNCAAGNWCVADNSWGINRLAAHGRYTHCSGNVDCSSNHVQLDLPNNVYRTVFLSNLDWSNCEYMDVDVSFDAGASFSHSKRIITRRTITETPYVSQIRAIATNLPIGADVQVRVVAARGRLHFEGFGLSRSVYPEVVERKSTDLVIDGTLDVNGGLRCEQRVAFAETAVGVSPMSYPSPALAAEYFQYGWICWNRNRDFHVSPTTVRTHNQYYSAWEGGTYEEVCGRISYLDRGSQSLLVHPQGSHYFGIRYLNNNNTWHGRWNSGGTEGYVPSGGADYWSLWVCR